MRSTRFTAPLLAASIAAFAAPPARPCSIAPPTIQGNVAPTDGDVGVPTNALLHLSMLQGGLVFAATRASGDGEPVALDVSQEGGVAIIDLGALEPDTAYAVQLSTAPLFEGDTEAVREPIRFTTGSGDDVTPPRAVSGLAVETEHEPGTRLFEPVSSCGPSSASNTIRVLLPAAQIDDDVVGFRLFRRLENGTRVLRRAVLRADLFGEQIVDTERDAGSYEYELVAFDAAGNESEPHAFTVDISPFGCSATARTSSPGMAVLFGALALALGARRRR
jgi:uncharacterized protein (TIGR03382 family)